MRNIKFTGVIEKEEFNILEPEFQYRKTEIAECPCAKIHILRIDYKETPYPKTKVKYKCPHHQRIYALDNIHDRWVTLIEDHEKEYIVEASTLE